MADKKAVGHAYNIDFLNVVFAASSIFLFASSLWMIWDDYNREWKNYQRRFVRLEMDVTRANLQETERAIDQNEIQALEAQRASAAEAIVTNQVSIDELEEQLDRVDADYYRVNQDYQFAKARYDAARYEFEALREEDPEEAAEDSPEIEQQFQEVTALNLDVEQLVARRDDVRTEIATYTGAMAEIDGEILDITTEQRRLENRLTVIEPSVVNTYLLNAPLLDFMTPTLRIRQVITPNVVDDVNFTRIPKMDRCTTCHLAIDLEGYEEYPQPFRTHSNLDAYVGSASPHPLEQTGCTVCHEGMGQSVTFVDVAHTPTGEEQTEAWEEEYHWEVPHLWDYPMLPTGMTEASCSKCHRGETFIPEATVLNVAYGMYERAGCYACHKTRGFEGMRKPGPSLTHIAAKLDPDWVKRWVRDPRAVKASTWMPRVWYNSNTSSPEDAIRNEVELNAGVAYLFANSDPYTFPVASPPLGDADLGQTIVESVGCLGCHVIDDARDEAGPRRTFGQPLQNIGSKTTYEWLFNWVRDPAHFSSGTYMPDLRLTDREAADVAAFLTTLTGPDGEAAKATYGPDDVEAVLLDYLKSVVPADEAAAQVAALDADARELELGRRVIGRYGCFSCHEIKGFETTQPIGIELSEEGTKQLTQLDFAFIDVPHTKVSWFGEKLNDPRIYDENRVLQPLERLRMPNYSFTDEEARLLTAAIMSFQREIQPTAAMVPRSARHDALVTGRSLVRRRNCVGCHEIEGDGGDYRAVVSDPSLAPPLLTPEGAKVQPDWMYAFFQGPITIRPWLAVRMPTFPLDDAHWNEVIRYFSAITDTVGPFRRPPVAPAAEATSNGLELFELLRCQQCHVLDEIPADQPTDNLAPDLRMASERLNPDWIVDWMRNPLLIQPGTRMPSFWPDYPESYYPQLDNDGEAQMRAIRDYLLTLRGGPNPKTDTASSN